MAAAQRKIRGSAMILAIATLGLVALLATVYLAASHVERQSSLATDDAVNLDFARDAVLAQIEARLYQDLQGPMTGQLLDVPYAWRPAHADTGFAPYAAFDPLMMLRADAAGRLILFQSEVVLGPDYRLYKCMAPHIPDLGLHGPPPGNTTDWAPLTAADWHAFGPVSSRWYDYPERPLDGTLINMAMSVDQQGHLDGARDEPILAKEILYPHIGSSDMTLLAPARYDPATGKFDLQFNKQLGWGPSTGDASAITNYDATWNLLPYSAANGTRYRFAVRVIDTGRFANLNTGFVGSTISTMDADGLSTCSVQLDAHTLFDTHDKPLTIHADRKGLINDRFEPLTQLEWQHRVHGWDMSGYNASTDWPSGRPLISPGQNAPLTHLFDLTDELELRAYGGIGTGYRSRPELDWGWTLAPLTQNGVHRNDFTTCSWDRMAVPLFPSKFDLLLMPPLTTKPLSPIIGWGGGTPMTLATPEPRPAIISVFTQLANTLTRCGYSQDEAVSFALNAAYEMTGNPNIAVTHDGQDSWLVISDGRHVVEKWVFYVPGVEIPYPQIDPPSPFAVNPPSDVYLPATAQPYLNEVDIALQPPEQQKGKPTALDFAVELLNPYTSRALNIAGWRIRVGDQPWFVFGQNRVPFVVPVAKDAAHPGLLTFNLSHEGGGFTGSDPRIHTVTDQKLDPVGKTVYLERPFIDERGDQQWLPVDQFAWIKPVPVLYPGGPPESLSFQRNNVTAAPTPTQPQAGAVDGWLAACPGTVQSLPAVSLGKTNPVAATDARLFGPYLADRWVDSALSPAGYGFAAPYFNRNIGQLEYLSRLGPRMKRIAAGSRAADSELVTTVPDELADTSGLFPLGGRSYFPQEAKVRFDFLADPRAIEFLRYFTTTELQEPQRAPGRVNVNTASGEVLYAVLKNITSDEPTVLAWTAAILAYRDRIRRDQIEDPLFRVAGRPLDFSDANLFPGRGIRSIAELAVPLGLADGQLQIDRTVSPPQIGPVPGQTLLSLHGTPPIQYAFANQVNSGPINYMVIPPDSHLYDVPTGVPPAHPGALWPRLFTQLTVRSDVFVVYGYMESLRIHPNVSLDPTDKEHHDNAYNWYDYKDAQSLEQVKTTVDDAGAKPQDDPMLRNLRLTQRRFIAIIDRSHAIARGIGGAEGSIKIVAVKDLPEQP